MNTVQLQITSATVSSSENVIRVVLLYHLLQTTIRRKISHVTKFAKITFELLALDMFCQNGKRLHLVEIVS